MNKLYRIPIRKLSVSHGDWTCCWPKLDYGPMEVQRSFLNNGISVAAAKPYDALMSACTIMYQAGSRFEHGDYLGASHFLRTGSSTSGQSYSGFTKMRYVAQHGAAITCTSDRQSIAYTLRCPVPTFSEMKCVLLDTIYKGCFRDWEIEDIKPMIREDLHRIHPERRVIDLAQKACWSGPLGNSMFCDPARIDDMTGGILNKYTCQNYKSDHCTVASIGVPFNEVMKIAQEVDPTTYRPESRNLVNPILRRGFESYDLGPSSETWICVGLPSCGTGNISNLIQHAIIAHACGTENMQEGTHTVDRTPQPPLGFLAGEDIYTSYRAFNVAYYDTGMFGIVARTPACSAWNVAISAAKFLRNIGNLNSTQIDIGKKRLKLSLAIHDEDCVKVTEGLALQLANGLQIDSALTSMGMIDQIDNDAISATALCLSKKYRDMALAVVGDIGQVPNEKELVLQSR